MSQAAPPSKAKPDRPAKLRRRLRLGPLWLELILFALVAGLAALALLTASERGTRLLFQLAERLSGGSVSVAHVEGTIWHELRLLDVRVDTTGSKVRLDRAELRWQPGALFEGRIEVQRLALGKLQISTQPNEEPVTVPASLALPLAVTVEDASLQGLTVDGQQILKLTRLKLDSDGDHHRLQLLQANTPWFIGEGTLKLGGSRPFPVDGKLAVHGDAEGAPWQVNMAISHSLEALTLKGKGAGGPQGAKPFKADFDLGLQPFSPSPYGILKTGRLDTEAMDLRVLSTSLPRTALDLTLQAEPRGEAVAATLTLKNPLAGDWLAGRLPLAEVQSKLLLDSQQVQIQQLQADAAGGKVDVTGKASLDKLDLVVVLSKLDPRRFGGPAMSLTGKLAVQGSPSEPHITGAISDQRLSAKLDIGLQGSGERRQLIARRIELDSAEGSLVLEGQLGLAAKQALTLKGKLAGFDPSTLSGLLDYKLPAGNLNADLAFNGQLAKPMGLAGKLVFQPSRFNGQPLTGQLQGSWQGEQLDDIKAALQLGSNRLNAQGGFGRQGEVLRLDVQLPDVADFGRDFKGRLEAQLSLSGTFRRPSLVGSALGEGLHLPGKLAVGRASLSARFDAAPDKPASSPLSLKLEVANLTAPEVGVDTLRLNLAGTQAGHTIDLAGTGKAAGQAFDLVLAANGALDKQNWRGRVETLENRGHWPLRLNAPMQLAISADGATLSGLDAVAVGAKIRVQHGEWHGGRFAGQGDIRDVAVAEWLGRLPDIGKHVATDLVLGARFDLRGDERLAGSLLIERQSGDLALSVDDPTIKPMPLKLSSARLQLDLNGEQATVAVDLKSAAFGTAAGKMTTRFQKTESGWQPARGAPLEGSLQAEMPSLAWIGPLLGPTGKVEGKLSAELTAAGVIGAPRWFGKLKAQDVAIRLPDAGINWQQGNLEATLDGDTAQLAAFSLKAGKGGVTAAGKMALRDAGPEGGLDVTFDHFGALTRPDRNLVVSGTSSLAVQGEALTLTGKLAADEGLIELPKSDAPVLGDDVVVKGRPQQDKRRSKPLLLTLRLDLDLGQKFIFKGQGVDARLSGLVRLTASPTQALAASGSLKVEEGRYAAHGQNLAISRGIVTFQGPIDNPALDILAERKNLPVEVGVKIGGTAMAPNVTLTSDTAMADAEKLSWLILGRGSASGGGDADLLLTAADALFTAGDSVSLRQQMAGRLGLDDISIGRSDTYTNKSDSKTDSAGNTSTVAGRVVSLGKRLSDRAYVSYEQSLDGVGYAVKLTYQLTRRVSVALTAGETSSADILYSWIFD
ncbi:translocation/assembly module TamB domain-containing protein [Chitinimonas naiadis]